MTTNQNLAAAGVLVTFREDSPQYDRNNGIVYLVTDAFLHRATTPGVETPCVSLVVEADRDLAPSRRRTRTARLDALHHVDAALEATYRIDDLDTLDAAIDRHFAVHGCEGPDECHVAAIMFDRRAVLND